MPFITDSSTLADTRTYTYDSTWSDKLSSYNGQAITYDSLGNPLTYKGATLTWQGRNLMTYTTAEKRVEYTYNADNLRTTKDVYDSLGRIMKSYTYTWADGKIIGYKVTVYSYEENATEPKGSIPLTIHYLYNESGEVYGFRLQNHSYAYVKDAFGSIVAIIDLETGSAVKELGYTAFGQLVDKTQVSTLTTDSADLSDAFDTLHNLINNNISLLFGTLFFDNLWMDSTLIYKDYAYDSDTGMYYLQSRYYDPEVSRFINMDDTEILKVTVGTLNGANLFAYCNNDPVLNSDPSGYLGTPIQWAFSIIGAILGVPFGKWIAHKLGYTKGWKYNAIRVAAVVGGAALGWFAGKTLIKLVSFYIKKNPTTMIKLMQKFGINTAIKIMDFFGTNFMRYMTSNTLISMAKNLSNPKLKLSLNFVKNLYDACRHLGIQMTVDSGHKATAWNSYHMHIGNKRIHLALVKEAYEWLIKRLR